MSTTRAKGSATTTIPHYPYDLFTDEVLLDPHPHYRALRELGPVVWLEAHQVYVLPRYAEVRAALADADTSSMPGPACRSPSIPHGRAAATGV